MSVQNDFETHSIGTAKEIALSRELARAIAQLQDQYPGVVPRDVMKVYEKLNQHYQWQIEEGIM